MKRGMRRFGGVRLAVWATATCVLAAGMAGCSKEEAQKAMEKTTQAAQEAARQVKEGGLLDRASNMAQEVKQAVGNSSLMEDLRNSDLSPDDLVGRVKGEWGSLDRETLRASYERMKAMAVEAGVDLKDLGGEAGSVVTSGAREALDVSQERMDELMEAIRQKRDEVKSQ